MITFLEKVFDARNRRGALLASVGAVLAIALVDWWTAPYISLGLLYLFPVMVAAGFLPRWAIVLLGLGCAMLAEAFGLPEQSWVRLVLEALALGGCGLFVSELLRSRSLTIVSQQRLRAIVETSPAAIVMLDDRGFVELANRAAEELMIPAPGSLLGQSIAPFIPDLPHALRRPPETQFRTSMECQARRGDGESFAAEVWFSTWCERAAPKLAAVIADVSEEHNNVDEPGEAPADAERPSLNQREVAILQLVFAGLGNRDIASRLEMTASAVKNTMERLFTKTRVHSRSQLVRVALERYRDLL